MNLSIVLDTAGAKVDELGSELRKILVDTLNTKYCNESVIIGIAIRCLPDSYNRRSFVRYTQKDNYLTIDFCVSLEKYEKLYKIEQRFELGITLLEWLKKGLSNKKFVENNLDFNSKEFLDTIVELGHRNGWFPDEIDWSLGLDK